MTNSFNLTKPQYNLTLSPNEIGIVHAALMELPAKVSMGVVNNLIAQIVAQENAKPPIVVDLPQKIEPEVATG